MIKLTARRERVGPILARHPWIFSGALKQIPDGVKSGEPAAVYDETGRFLAQGYFNSYSQIAVRLWSWDEKEEINQKFFDGRIEGALKIRQDFVLDKKTDSCRLVNAENDLLPGLIVDKYGDYLCLQCHTPGIERWKKEIVAALVKILKPKGIYERSDVRERRTVPPPFPRGATGGLPSSEDGKPPLNPSLERRGGEQSPSFQEGVGPASPSPLGGQGGGVAEASLLHGKVPERVKILENGLKFYVDIIRGQKTGFFLDQRDKRRALMKYADGKNVLNCFSYTGGFGVYALAGGAKSVTSVDTSQPALDIARENVELNDFNSKKCQFLAEDVKQYMVGELARAQNFDVIILDPPAFIKDRHKINEGLFGYKKINEAAMRLLPPGGILVSASCSAHLSLPDFRFMLAQSAGRAGRTLQILETFTHGVDHPSLVTFNEGEYLKCIFALVR